MRVCVCLSLVCMCVCVGCSHHMCMHHYTNEELYTQGLGKRPLNTSDNFNFGVRAGARDHQTPGIYFMLVLRLGQGTLDTREIFQFSVLRLGRGNTRHQGWEVHK